jgi:hypothetical protein
VLIVGRSSDRHTTNSRQHEQQPAVRWGWCHGRLDSSSARRHVGAFVSPSLSGALRASRPDGGANSGPCIRPTAGTPGWHTHGVTVEWGPWEASSENLTLLGPGDDCCSFGPVGITARHNGESVSVPWNEVLDIEVEVPTYPLWLWWLLAPAFFLVPSAIQQSTELYVRVATRRGTRHLHLGRPPLAPYPLRCRTGTEALFAALESGRLEALLASGCGELLIRAAQGSAHWSGAVSERRLRQALVQIG